MNGISRLFAAALLSCGAATLYAECDVPMSRAPERCREAVVREIVYVRDLAHRFRYAEVTNEESAAILAEVRALTPDESTTFNETLIEFSLADIAAEGRPATAQELAAMDTSRILSRRAAELHVSLIDLDDETIVAFGDDRVGGERKVETNAFCYIAPSMPDRMYGATCGRNCSPATYFDRHSTGKWEVCDFRIFFRSSRRLGNIDGKTTQADCVVLRFGSLISRYAGGNTEAIIGATRTAACGVFTGSYLRTNLQAF